MDDTSAILDRLRQLVPGASLDVASSTDMPTLTLDRDHLIDVLRVLRDDPALQFAFLVDVTAVDYLPAEPRFELVYHLACLGAAYATGPAAPARRLRLKVRLPAGEPRIASVTPVYPTAGWPEREVFDLFGIHFEGHADLRRILMPDDWEGYPLRKDYPVQIRKTAQSWSPLQLTAEEFAQNIRGEHDRAVADAETQLRKPRD
ncbi:MAG: NADH-quinone oxidoreductase subunit C [Vicinamibacterales bacterium]